MHIFVIVTLFEDGTCKQVLPR